MGTYSDDIIAAARVAVSIEAGILAERKRCLGHVQRYLWGDLGINGPRAAAELKIMLEGVLKEIESGGI